MGSRDMVPLRDGTKQRNPTYLRERNFREMFKFDALVEPNRDIQRRALNIPYSQSHSPHTSSFGHFLFLLTVPLRSAHKNIKIYASS